MSVIGLTVGSGEALAQNLCVPILGGQSCTIDTDTTTQPVAAVVGNVDATVDASGDLLGQVALDATGNITLLAQSSISSALDNTAALDLMSGGSIDAAVQGLATTGDNAAGALIQAGDTASLLVDGAVTTTGLTSDGIHIVADAIDLTAGQIMTQGDDSDGVDLVSLDGPIMLDVDGIHTLGDGSDGAVLNAAGDIDLDVGVLRTEGGQALGAHLVTDPAACLALGAGSCSIGGTIGSILTDGPGSIGALVEAAGPTSLTIDAIETHGDDAAALEFMTDPMACAALGAGSCGSSYTLGNLLTLGDNAPGVLATVAGPTMLDIDTLETDGANSPGISVTGDPNACLTLGIGACNTDLALGNVLTTGPNSGGVFVDVPAMITGDLGVVETQGDDSPGVTLIADPTACATLGVGSCGVDVSSTSITTGGDRSAGIGVAAAGPIMLDLGDVSTMGADSPAISVLADPAACAVLGTGECSTTIDAGNVTTGGDGSAGVGALVSGPISVTTGDISTMGMDAPGVVLVTDPTACLVAGAASCTTDLDTGSITTEGDGAFGVGVLGAGPVHVMTGDVSTMGVDAAGVIVAADPAVCAVLGSASCMTEVSTGAISTQGDGATGLGIVTSGPITVMTGPVSTLGNNAEGVTVTADPTACVLVGAASCVTDVTTGNVSTEGDSSGGVLVSGAGPVMVDTGDVSTLGMDSPGVMVSTDPAICTTIGAANCTTDVSTGAVTTGGDGSIGVGVLAGGPTTVMTGPVTTMGENAPGVTVTTDPAACLVVGAGSCTTDVITGPVMTGGGNSPGVIVTAGGPTTVTTGPITTTGNDSDGLVVHIDPTLCAALGTASCPVAVEAGPIDSQGPGSGGVIIDDGTDGMGGNGGPVTVVTGPITTDDDGINVDVGCRNVDITATGPIRSNNGDGIEASSACHVRVETLAGAPVSGHTSGITVTSGTGSDIIIGDRLESDNGLALDVNGAATNVLIRPTGTVVGRIDLTDNDDVVTNNGRFEAFGDSSFGAGTDLFANNGTLMVRPGAAAAGNVTFAGLETFANTGLVDMRNGQVGDTLTLPGTYSGSGNSRLGVDVGATTADTLVVGGAATGVTTVLPAGLGGLVNGAVVVDGGAGTSAGAFVLADSAMSVGAIDYSLVYDAAANDFAIYGLPNQSAYSTGMMTDGARQLSYRTTDAVGAQLDSVRTGRAFWIQGYGSMDRRRGSVSTSVFGQPVNYSLATQQDFFGFQAGADLLASDTGTVAGLTFGYGTSHMKSLAGSGRARFEDWNVGVYGRFVAGPFRLEGLAKYERIRARYFDSLAGLGARDHSDSFGGYVKASARFGSEGMAVEPFVSLDYAHIRFDGFDSGPYGFAFDPADGLRGKAGARVESIMQRGDSTIRLYASGAYVHEFKGEDRVTFTSNGLTTGWRLAAAPDYAQAKLGVAIDQGSRVSGFIEAIGDFGKHYHGGGARGGISIKF